MTKARTKKPARTQGANHDVKTSVHRTDTALRPATPLETMVSRALDQELEWYFSYAEGALRRACLPILPSYAVAASEPTDDALRARAIEITEAVQRCLVVLRGKHAEILRAAYTPRSWPKPVATAFGPVTPIAVRLAFADDPWPERHSREGIERAAATRLRAAIVSKSIAAGRLRSQAERLLGSAIVAYAGARALAPSALGVPSTRSR
jgi:hypothetical protein